MNLTPDVTLIAYVPAPHRGYLDLFQAYSGAALWVLGSDLIAEFPALTRHLPGAAPETVATMIGSLGIFSHVRVLTRANLEGLQLKRSVVMPDEDVAHALAEKYFVGVPVAFDGSWRLRWNWDSVNQSLLPEGERTISVEELDRELMRSAYVSAARSSDWWRQVGAVLAKDGVPQLSAFNKHQPSEQSPYLYGDPRSNFEPGQVIDASTALHAEIGIIAEAARRGISMEGCDLYVTTFPCPPCAYACANTGISRLFYSEGYSRIEGGAALTAKGVELIRVETPSPE